MTKRFSRYDDVVTEEDARKLLRKLSRRFKVREPALRITKRRRGGVYWSNGTIELTLKSGHGPKFVLAHEFAHHLTHNKPMRHRTGSRRGDMHGRDFQRNLWAVVRWAYRYESEYAWGNEYDKVARFGKRKVALANSRRLRAAAEEEGTNDPA
ncbi:MAG: hypothetical protein ACREMG_04200 [Gemmatimonadales bacterium]